jgi:hypothetical protein
MKTREEILAYILNTTENTVKYYRNEMIVTPKQAMDAMHQYAMEKIDEINKLNKSDVISSVCNHEWKPYYDKGYRKCTNCGMELGMPLQNDL